MVKIEYPCLLLNTGNIIQVFQIIIFARIYRTVSKIWSSLRISKMQKPGGTFPGDAIKQHLVAKGCQ